MNKTKVWFRRALFLVGLLGLVNSAQAGLITSTLGNSTSGFNDGDTPTTAAVGAVQGGQPAPFDQGYGTDGLFGGNFSQSWTHNYAPIVESIASAIISFGIVDHDSSASGNQLASFTFAGEDLTAALNPLFEAGGGSLDLEYNVYTLSLPVSTFATLAAGSASGALGLQGPGLVTPLFPLPGPNPPQETSTNGANLIFSTLEITTRGAAPTPEPAGLPLILLGFSALIWRKTRHSRRN